MAVQKKAAKRVGRRKHPGVTLASPVGTHWYRLIWTDPDTGKRKKETLDRALNKAACVEKARRKSEEIAERKRQLAAGATRATGQGLRDAIESYYTAHPHLRERTQQRYRDATERLEAWAKAEGIKSGDELTRGHLMELREKLIAERKRVPVKDGERGAYKTTRERRSPNSVNGNLRAIRTVLGYLVDRQSLPKLTHDDLRRGLKQLEVTRDVTHFLKGKECSALLEAAMRHDAQVVIGRDDELRLRREAKRLGITRAELDKLEPQGTTPRFTSIAPFVAFVLLTGMRLSEAVDLDWKQVDLDALDDHGQAAGAITLTGTATKTRRGRVVGLEVSPALRSLLAAMKLRSGGKGRVFPSRHAVVAAGKRLEDYGAPEGFTWQALRRTCGTFLTNSPGIFGAASAYRSAQQLGHSVTVAEKAYLGLARGIPREATTLEAAMGIEGTMAELVKSVGAKPKSNVVKLGAVG